MEELIVPRYLELPDRLPSPDSWSKWGVSPCESFRSPNKFFDMDSNLVRRELNHHVQSICDEVELDAVHNRDQSNSSSTCDGLPEESLYQRALSCDQPDSQLNGFPGFGQTNDNFLNTLFEDLPETDTIDGSFYFSPESKCGTKPIDNQDSKSMSSYENNPVGDVTDMQYMPCNLDQIDCTRVQGPYVEDMVSSEQSTPNSDLGQETSPEESALLDLEMVMAQLTEGTRICFRDAFYRLADNSKAHWIEMQGENGHLAVEKPRPLTASEPIMRSKSGNKKAMESGTNAIDRAVADLIFKEIDSCGREFSSAASENSNGVVRENRPTVDSKPKAVGAMVPPTYGLKHPKILHVSQGPTLQGDAEVPSFALGSPRAANLYQSF